MRTFFGSNNKAAAPGQKGAVPSLSPRLPPMALVDAHLFVSEVPSWRVAAAEGPAVWVSPGLALGDTKDVRQYSFEYRPSEVRGHTLLSFSF